MAESVSDIAQKYLTQSDLSRSPQAIADTYLSQPRTLPPAPPPADKGFFGPAFAQGVNLAQAGLERGGAAVAGGLGFPGIQQSLATAAQQDVAEGLAKGNPAYQKPIMEQPGLINKAKQLGYDVVSGAPQLAAMLGGGMVGAALAPEVAGAGFLGTAAAAYPFAAGSAYQQIEERNKGKLPTAEESRTALAYGVPGAALQAVGPEMLGGLAGLTGKTAAKTVAGEVAQAAEKPVQNALLGATKDVAKTGVFMGAAGGAQTALEQTLRPDLTAEQKTRNVYESVVQNTIVGAGMGTVAAGIGRMREARNVEPAKLTNENLNGIVDTALNPKAPKEGFIPSPETPANAAQMRAQTEAREATRAQEAAQQAAQEQAAKTKEKLPTEEAPRETLGKYTPETPYAETPRAELEQLVKREGIAPEEQQRIQQELTDRVAREATLSTTEKAQRVAEEFKLNKSAIKPLEKMNLDHEQGIYGAVRDFIGSELDRAIEKGTEPKLNSTIKTLNEKLGLFDLTTGKPRDLDAERSRFQTMLEAAQTEPRKEAVQKRIDEFDAMIRRRDEALTPKETPSAIQEPSPEGILPRELTEAGQPVGERNAEGQIAGEGLGAEIGKEIPGQERPQELTAEAGQILPREEPLAPVDAGAPQQQATALREGETAPEAPITLRDPPPPRSVDDSLERNSPQAIPPREIPRAPEPTIDQLARGEEPLQPEPVPTIKAGVPETGDAGFTTVREAVGEAVKEIDRDIDKPEARTKWQERVAQGEGYLLSGFGLARVFKERAPEVEKIMLNREMQDGVRDRFISTGLDAMKQFEATPKKHQAGVNELMLGHSLGLDTFQSWKDNAARLERDFGVKGQQLAELQKKYDQLSQVRNGLTKAMGEENAYTAFRYANQADWQAHNASLLRSWMQLDPTFKEYLGDRQLPSGIEQYIQLTGEAAKPKAAVEFWRNQTNELLKLADEYIATREQQYRAETKSNTPERRQASGELTIIRDLVKQTRERSDTTEQNQYFHLGRDGDYGVSFSLKDHDTSTPAGRAAYVADVAKLNDLMRSAGFDKSFVSDLSNQKRVFLRVDSEQQMNRLAGFIRNNSDILDQSRPVEAQPRDKFPQASRSQPFINMMDQKIDSHRLYRVTDEMRQSNPELVRQIEANKARAKQAIRDVAFEMSGDNDFAKVLTHRDNIQGFNQDMALNFANRNRMGAESLARLATGSERRELFSQLNDRIQEAAIQNAGDVGALAGLRQELLQREGAAGLYSGNSAVDVLKSLTNTGLLGFNPSRTVVELASILHQGIPEIVRQNNVGFMKASRETAKAAGLAFKVVRAAISEGVDRGWKQAADAGITDEALQRAGISKEDIKHLNLVANLGGINTGGLMREMGRMSGAAEALGVKFGGADSRLDTIARYGAIFGYYTELFSRVTTALAAKNTYKGKPLDELGMARHSLGIINESLRNFSNWNDPRAFSRGGPLGAATPLATTLQRFNLSMTEKLYLEVKDAFTAVNPEQREAAQRFLKTHLAMVATTSGLLGLPLAGAAVGAYDSLADKLDPEGGPHDVRADMDSYLRDTFGETAGAAIQHGAPRLAGVDISSRTGEQDLPIGSHFLFAARSAKDGLVNPDDFPVISLADSVMRGMGQLSRGDYVEAARNFMPTGLKNMMDAVRWANDGKMYDSKGREIPALTPGTSDVIKKFFGFNPAEKADLSEKQRREAQYKGGVSAQRGPLKQNFFKAVMSQDRESTLDALKKIQAYDAAHPDTALGPTLDTELKRYVKTYAQARANKAPTTVNYKNRQEVERVLGR